MYICDQLGIVHQLVNSLVLSAGDNQNPSRDWLSCERRLKRNFCTTAILQFFHFISLPSNKLRDTWMLSRSVWFLQSYHLHNAGADNARWSLKCRDQWQSIRSENQREQGHLHAYVPSFDTVRIYLYVTTRDHATPSLIGDRPWQPHVPGNSMLYSKRHAVP